jgi:hypothetical protein
MKLKYDAVAYVMEHGSPYHRAQVLAALGETGAPTFARAVGELRALCDAKGRWPWRWNPRNPWATGETARAAKFLVEFGEDGDGGIARNALDCFVQRQRIDGGWANNPDLAPLIPKEWEWLSAADSSPAITGEVLSCLAVIDCRLPGRIARARKFIYRVQNKEGGWPTHVGPRYAYGSDPAAFAEVLGGLLDSGDSPKATVVTRAVRAIHAHKSEWSEPAFNPLDTFLMLGWDPLSPIVDGCVKLLIERQRPDGGWNWFGDMPSDPGQTAYWLPKLILCGVTF